MSDTYITPVAYDKSIQLIDGKYVATVRMDGETITFTRDTLYKAQVILDFMTDDVFEGAECPPASVFFKGADWRPESMRLEAKRNREDGVYAELR